MAHTYSQLYIQAVFAVKGRKSLLSEKWEKDLYKYISSIISAKGNKSIIVNGFRDHIHLFFGLNPAASISDIIREIKNNSNKFINSNRLTPGKFEWQTGYGVFSYSHSQIDRVYNYILNQKEHHRIKTFTEEYKELLDEQKIDFIEKYYFDEIP